jgi:acetyl-CoA carboxylase biotin carboxyl carrier protein
MVTNGQSDRRLTEVAEIVQTLVETMCSNGLSKIDVEVGDISIRLRAGGVREVVVAAKPEVDLTMTPATVTAVIDAGHFVTAPMIGTFYTSAGPGELPFVHVGDRVDPGQVIGIIEAMKIMNEIVADRGGIVAEMIAGNGQPVEYGSPLIRLLSEESGG